MGEVPRGIFEAVSPPWSRPSGEPIYKGSDLLGQGAASLNYVVSSSNTSSFTADQLR